MSLNLNIENLAGDISFAVFRVSRVMRHRVLAEELEACAVALLARLGEREIDALLRLVLFAERTGEMTRENVEVLARALARLRELLYAETAALPLPRNGVEIRDMLKGIPEEAYENGEEEEKGEDNQEPRERRQAIWQFIRQFPGDCRMKDVRAHFPHVSERTIRTDMRRLEGQGLVLRRGKGGPSSHLVALRKGERKEKEGQVPVEDKLSEVSNEAPGKILLPEPSYQEG